ncbi:MAG: hypothetical protein CL920_07180 [Deltaproteobacteria bacterium]|nr:hypothetical protein [Deltaproteobacteria bacterium]|tara:strand:- start:3409 stop:3927 length:519 start_codon:yes stop_codon:yes gene_type:complete
MTEYEEHEERVEEIELDPILLERYMKKLRDKQSPAGAVIGGLVAALFGAGIWAGITYATNTKFGLVALLIGVMAGYGVRIFGKGIDTHYRYIGAFLALVGCVAGTILTVALLLNKAKGVPVADLLFNPRFIVAVMKNTQPFDYLFYAIGIYEGYQFSLVEIDPEEMIRETRA